MAAEQANALGRYIYAILDDRDGAAGEKNGFPWGEECPGFGGGRVRLVSEGRVADGDQRRCPTARCGPNAVIWRFTMPC